MRIRRWSRAAQKYAENAGVAEREDDELYDLLIYMLSKHWYDNREAVVMSNRTSDPKLLPLGVNALVHQLR